MMDSLLQNPSILAGIGVFLLGGIILMVLVYVRGKKKGDATPADGTNENATQVIGADPAQNQAQQQTDPNSGDLPQLDGQSPLNNPVAQPQDNSMAGQPTVGDTPNVQNMDTTTPMEQTNFGTESLDNAAQPTTTEPTTNDPAANMLEQAAPAAPVEEQQTQPEQTQVVDLGGNDNGNPSINDLGITTDNSSPTQAQETSASTTMPTSATDTVNQSNTFETVVGGPQADVPQFATENPATMADPVVTPATDVATATPGQPEQAPMANTSEQDQPVISDPSQNPVEPSATPIAETPPVQAAPSANEPTAPAFDINQPNQSDPVTPPGEVPAATNSLPDISAIETNTPAAAPISEPVTPAPDQTGVSPQTPTSDINPLGGQPAVDPNQPVQPVAAPVTNAGQPTPAPAADPSQQGQPNQQQNNAGTTDLTDLGLPPI